MWKTAWKLKDTDFLIKTWYDKLSKTLKSNKLKNANSTMNNNISTASKYSKKPAKISGQESKVIKNPTPTIQKEILSDISKLSKATAKEKEVIARSIVAKLWVAKKDTIKALKIVKDYIKKYWAELKDKLWEMIDDINKITKK